LKKYTYSKQEIIKSDVKKVISALNKDYLSRGPIISNFEKKLSSITKAKYAIAVNSGTSALIAAVQSLSLKKNSYILVPNITFIASASAALLSGYKVILADVCKNTGLLKIKELKKIIKKKNISCLINVHLNGNIENLKEIYSVCKSRNIKIIDDACHALGTSYKLNNKNYTIGDNSFCDISTLSFHPTKLITTGEGGAILTNNKIIRDKVRLISNHGYKNYKIKEGKHSHNYYKIENPGYNFRISDLNCALGFSQLTRIKKKLAHRRKIARFYNQFFMNNEYVETLQIKENIKCAYHLYPIFIKNIKKINKLQLMKNLKKKNIITQIHYLPLNKQPLFRSKLFPESEIYYKKTLSIPIHESIKILDAKKIAKIILNEIKKITKN
jgi:dTDP-4-amino-4,6-dideoxygalactose transaminase